MAVARFFRLVKRRYGFCAKFIAVALLGLCFIFLWSTFLSSSSAVASQRSSFSDIKETFSADGKLKDSRVRPKKREPDGSEAHKGGDNTVESILGGKDKRKGGGHVSHHNNNNHNAGKKDKEADLVISNATRVSEGSNNGESQKIEDQGQIEQEEEEVEDAEEEDGRVIEDSDLNDSGDQQNEEKLVEEIEEPISTGKKKKKVGPVFDSRAQYTWKPCNVRSKYNYIPCIDIEHATKKLQSYRHRERSCPGTPMCLVPLPHGGYQSPVRWPESKSKILYGNVAHPKLAAFIKTRSWIIESEQYLTFPEDQSEFKGGVLNYIESIDEMVPDIEWGKNIRIVLDIGCTDSSFVASLLEKEVLTFSLGLKDDLVDLAQVALERGFPAFVSPFGARRLPFPSGVFDAIHCGACGIRWDSNEGKLLEMNRILRPGGYFISSAKHENIQEEEAMSSLTASICWNILAYKTHEISEMGVKIYQKPELNDIYALRRKKSPPMCKDDENPDAAWYVPMKTCLHKIPTGIEQRGTEWPEEWPKRLETFHDWLVNKENVVAETERWKAIVNNSYLNGMGIDWSSIRNVMDMKSIYGGFAAALLSQKVWVMNVVPVNAPETLAIIYERGLLGIYHDWCESFGTYPRSYDLLHADHLFSRLKNRCKQPVGIVVEMDRILRPDGWAIIRDKVEILDPLEVILRSLHWEIRMTYAQDKEGIICAQKTTWRP
ncbi:probable methyltransferase PMT28 [Macadamia integrifolia]|uniref:probable methyltransferase PMT28 n=1 Tax=Macadamia integrifolia TaxID=60698 RepID=UPI001C4EC403|nr:probable methyltransferase PMT28 [Macadamia integrifolia]